MSQPVSSLQMRLLFLILPPALSEKAVSLFEKGHIPLQLRFAAEGTASDEIMNVLGLNSSEKIVLLCMLPKDNADILLGRTRMELGLGAINSGIGFTVPVSGASRALLHVMDFVTDAAADTPEKELTAMSEENYSLIMTIVDQGYSEEVMDAARTAGARGGTVFAGRRLVNEENLKFWGITVQPEKEIVLIVTARSQKVSVMEAVSTACGYQSAAHGLVLSLPVDRAVGLTEYVRE